MRFTTRPRLGRAVGAAAAAAALAAGGALGLSTIVPHVQASTNRPNVQASIVGDPPAGEQVGYAFTNGQFEKVVGNVYLRAPAQYHPEVASYGDSVQLLTATRQITLGISDCTGSAEFGNAICTAVGDYSPGFAVFDRSGSAPSDALSLTSASQFDSSANVPAGHTARLSMFYSKNTGVVHATVLDVTTGVAASVSYDLGLGAKITEVRVGNEVGCYADSDPRVVNGCGSDVNSPTTTTKLATLSGLVLQNYKNTNFTTLLASRYFSAGRIMMTSNGTSSGTDLAEATPFNAAGNSFNDNLIGHP